MKAIVAKDQLGQVVWVKGNSRISPLSYAEFREAKGMKSGYVEKNGVRYEAPFSLHEEDVSESLNGSWVDEDVARCWPTGIIVLIHRLDRPNNHYRAVEVCGHFRPDWIGEERGYGRQPTEFMRLSK